MPHIWSIFTSFADFGWDESLNRHSLLTDFVLLAKRLEKLGFIYSKGSVVVMADMEPSNDWF